LHKAKDELYWINKAISNFQHRFEKSTRQPNAQIKKLSKTISYSTGLSDKKGNSIYQPAPVSRWQKRKNLIQRKLGEKEV
jgi:hypothetical protein